MSGIQVLLAGQDISDLVNEETIHIESVLGQGAGAGSEGAGETTTADMVVDLPISSAIGAGQSRSRTYAETVLADTPAGYWRMNSESTCLDFSGNNNNGTVLGGLLQLASGATGDRNPAWGPDGVSYVQLPLTAANGIGGVNMLSYNQSSFEVDASGYKEGVGIAGGGSVTRDTTTSQFGTASLKCVTSGGFNFQFVCVDIPASNFIPGQTYTFSAYMKVASGTPTVRFYCQADQNLPSNTHIGTVGNITLSTTWTRYTFTITMPGSLPYSVIGMRWDTSNTNQAITVYMDGLQIEQGGSATTWVAGGGAVTQEALVYVENANAAGPIMYTGDWGGGFGFGIGNGSNWTSPGVKLIARNGTSWITPVTPISLPIGQWTHVVAVWSSGGTLTFYINSVAQTTISAFASGAVNYNYIGGTSNGDRASNIQIDEVATYTVALASSRISAHYGAIGVVPVLVRQGEIIVKDATGTPIFGGYVTNLKRATDQQSLVTRTEISCHDYFQGLDRIEVNEVYTGRDDVYIIKDILTKYAPFIDQSALPASGTYTFTKRLVRAKSVKQAFQKLAAVTGWLIWIGPDKKAYYKAPSDASTAPFGLSDSPDFVTTFTYDLLDYSLDENAIINRVYFYGGKQESPDFTQDLKPQYNGTTNKTFLLAYYPHNAADGNIHVTKNGSDLTLGNVFDTGSSGKLIADGGTAQVLINYAAETLTFDTSVLSSVTTLTCTYRYNTPLVIVVSDKSSYQFYGAYYDGKLDDSSVLDATTATQRARVLLAQQSYGLVHIQVVTWTGGLQAGQLVQLVNSVEGLNSTYQVQKVTITPLGGGYFEYTVDMGAWNWGTIDLIMATARRAGVQDDEDGENTQVIQAQEFDQTLHVTDVWTLTGRTSGVYYSRAAPVGDGHDAYCGFCTITS